MPLNYSLTTNQTKGTKMKQCEIPNCENTNLVFSGVAAFLLGGIPTEKYCYPCANAYVVIKERMDSISKLVEASA
jgi:hypothetical protein